MPERRRADSFTSSHNPPSEWSQRAPSIGEEEASPGQGAWRRWLALRGGGACELRRLPLGGNPDAALPAQPSSFFAMPLQPLDLSKLVAQRTRTQRKLPPVEPTLPFDLARHPSAQSPLARAMLTRLETDVAEASGELNGATTPQLLGFCDGELLSKGAGARGGTRSGPDPRARGRAKELGFVLAALRGAFDED